MILSFSSSSSFSEGSMGASARTRTTATWILALLALLVSALVAKADTTNDSADAEVQGQALAERILAARPAADSTNLGVLQIRNAEGERTELPIEARTILTPAGWVGIYEVTTNTDRPNDFIRILHRNGPNLYWTSWDPNAANAEYSQSRVPPLSEPFAGSDFSMGDLGLEFFHWPQQKILKKEFHRQCACMVLESTNPHPTPNGYSRVVSWIDEESLGIVEAYAYDATGRKLKNFYPKSLEKVNGRYQVESMVMENLQTGSKSVFEFDLHK